MSLLKDAGVPTPKFGVAKTAAEARKIAEELGTKDLVIKAQVLAGGRGKGRFANYPKGGVQLLYSPDEIEEAAKGMIGDFLITKQTGAEGRICNSVMITERKYTRKEYYLAFTNDRKFAVSFHFKSGSILQNYWSGKSSKNGNYFRVQS